MSDAQAEYRSYLLRVWRAGANTASVWRASLENPHTGERVGFASLEQLFAYVMEQTEGGGNERRGRLGEIGGD